MLMQRPPCSVGTEALARAAAAPPGFVRGAELVEACVWAKAWGRTLCVGSSSDSLFRTSDDDVLIRFVNHPDCLFDIAPLNLHTYDRPYTAPVVNYFSVTILLSHCFGFVLH